LLCARISPLSAASTGTTELHRPQGSGAGTANGDYITAEAGGLDTVYRYFIEVPPGLNRLIVEIWDADIGRGGGNEDTAGRDRNRGDYDTDVDYDLIRPDGTTANSLNNCDDNACSDNAWTELFNSTNNLTAGHWELRVDMTSGETDGDDINAFGIRAHDGTSGATGTELNVYYDSHSSFGANPPASGTNSDSYTIYPYITSGCTAAKNDFDFDSNSGTVGSLALASRTGAFTQSYASASMSSNNAWRRDSFSGWASDTAADDYGIWEADLTIQSYLVSGNPNGNYGHLYFTNSQAAANPPAANPTTNAFRVYLPNDAGTAPAKPYVEQFLTHKSGPNPVPVNQSSRFQVTVRVVNPGAQAITFSAANLVTANIPGSGAVYAGNAAVGQGSIVSQPVVGGTGNVTWNPGTLAAGATSILTYQVDITPTAAGQRVRATGTPASNGTRAQYVDNTGNTTQARATYLFGSLCELAVTQGQLLTEAVVSSFRALPGRQGGVLVEWTTASEERTAGFRLFRREGRTGRLTPVHDGLLAALAGSPQGGTYRFLDEGAWPREPQVYLLEEVEAGGKVRRHGTFRVSPWEETAEAPEVAGRFERTAHPARAAAPERVAIRPEPLRAEGKATSSLHLSVRETGLVHVSAGSLAAAGGLPVERIAQEIGSGRISLRRDGLPVAWHPDRPATQGRGGAAGLFFYSEAPDSLYSDVAVYRLDIGAKDGVLMEVEVMGNKPVGDPADTFVEARHDERDLLPATAIALDPESDYWFWEFLQGDDPTFGVRTFELDAPGVSSVNEAKLAVGLHGATTTGVAGEHRVEARLNGTYLGETQWEGIAPEGMILAVPPGILLETGNLLELTARTGGGAAYSFTYLDGLDLAYRRFFRAAGDSLTFAPADLTRVTVSGFTDAAVRLLDVSDPRLPRWIEGAGAGADKAGGWNVSFAPTPGARYLAAGPSAVQAPLSVRPWTGVPKIGRADYLVIAPSAWRTAAERLTGWRQSQGLASAVVSLEEIAGSYGDGVATPHAIRAFLTAAWQGQKVPPRYVVLAGRGTIDYRDLLGYADNVLPPLLVQSAGGLFPSDNRLADVSGDGLPEMAVGRIPVLTESSLQAFVDKLIAYETGAPAEWARRVLLLSDGPDQGTVFAADSDRIAAQIPFPVQAERIDLGTELLSAARARLFAGLSEGAGLVNYLGHGGLDRLAAGGLLTSADVAGLTNGDRLPVLTAMTCTVNRFAVPGVPSLGELLVESAGGGAVAVWGPSGLADSRASRELAEIFYRRTAERGTLRLGDLILRSYAELRAQGGSASLPDIYNLLGDPALRLRSAPEGPAGGGSGGE
jgi:hypothetical protein